MFFRSYPFPSKNHQERVLEEIDDLFRAKRINEFGSWDRSKSSGKNHERFDGYDQR